MGRISINGYLDRALTTEQFTYKELRGMYLSLILDTFFIFFIGMVSTALISSVGEAAIAAVSMVSTVNGLVSLVFSSMATGGAIVVARAKGRGDRQDIRRAIGEVTGICGAVALVLSTLLFLFSEPLVNALYPSVEPLLVTYAVDYMRMMAISFIPFAIFNAVFNILRNLGNTRQSLVLTIVINVVHLGLSVLFINVLHMGVAGSGLSYIVARVIGMVVALLMVLVFYNEYGVRIHHFFHFQASTTREIVSLGMPLALESLLMQGGMLLVQVYLARLTTVDLAAHAVAGSILNIYTVTGSALVSLASTVCGRCYGAGKYDLTRRYAVQMIRIGRVILLLTVALFYLLTPAIMRMYNATEEGAPIILTALRIAAVAIPILWCDSSVTAMALRCAGDSFYAGMVSVVSLMLGRCLLGYLLTITAGMGVPGIWLAMVAEWGMRAVAFRLRLKGETWLHRKAPEEAGEKTKVKQNEETENQ